MDKPTAKPDFCTDRYCPAWAEIDLDAIGANVRTLAELANPAALMAVVKADGYGHGAVPVAHAALDAGATWLGVALVEEGAELRAAGIDAPVMVLSEPPPAAAPAVVGLGLTPVAYTPVGIEALAKAVAEADGADRLPVHLKVDTGMHRVGCTVEDALAFADALPRRRRARQPVHGAAARPGR
jgi:alanine racemase